MLERLAIADLRGVKFEPSGRGMFLLPGPSRSTQGGNVTMAKMQSEAGAKSEAGPDLLRAVSRSGHEIWLAGVGALYTARREGSKLFELLVDEGRACAGALTAGRVRQVRSQLSAGVGSIERLVEKRLARLLVSADVPSASDVGELSRRVAELDRHVCALARRNRAGHGRKSVKRKIRSQARP